MWGNSKKYHSLVVDNTGENKVKSLRDQKKKRKINQKTHAKEATVGEYK